jgi:hypothetical protein
LGKGAAVLYYFYCWAYNIEGMGIRMRLEPSVERALKLCVIAAVVRRDTTRAFRTKRLRVRCKVVGPRPDRKGETR